MAAMDAWKDVIGLESFSFMLTRLSLILLKATVRNFAL